MRVLFLPMPAIGHAFPMVPLAWSLRGHGHEVRFATSGAGLAVEQAGLPVTDVEPGLTMGTMMQRLRAERPEMAVGNAPVRDITGVVPAFAQVSRYFVEPVVRIARQYRPDVIVYSSFNGGALLAAGLLGIPAIDVGVGFGRTSKVGPLLAAELADVFAEYGTEPPKESASIDVAPPSMAEVDPADLMMRFVPYNGGAVLPGWLAEPLARPRIGVTLGTVSPQMNGLSTVERILAVAEKVEAEFVFALGDVDLGGFGVVPPNVRLERWVPLDGLLATCTALVHHGGGGTTLTALDAGVAQLVLPDGADRHINAAAVATRGVGLECEPEQVDAAVLGALVEERGYRDTAAQVREELHGMPSPGEIARGLDAW
ncbi:nucleotide disphospho-sugar-binding domain-containing protein [Sciscionella sediminilitoris]|uniref:nucleotide disphospho-sugar-binding domain-containing protein n=1 Tax=Sciscionella sediminilitoris TaxID=1445613 RepID=UPI0004DFB022|nr:nucleotide disphospho-sugar-binding domain-containing protein [Sciscionella sp. SE31]